MPSTNVQGAAMGIPGKIWPSRTVEDETSRSLEYTGLIFGATNGWM